MENNEPKYTFTFRLDETSPQNAEFYNLLRSAKPVCYIVRQIAPGIWICDNEQAAKAWDACFIPRIGRERMN